MGVTAFLLEPGPVVSEGPDGFEIDCTWRVDGLAGTAAQRMYQCMSAPGLPAFNSPLAPFPDVRCRNRVAEFIDTDKANVLLVYRVPTESELANDTNDPGVVSIALDSRGVQERVTEDSDGNPMINRWTGGALLGANFANVLVEADIFVPQLTYIVTYNFRDRPDLWLENITGAVNTSAWSGKPAFAFMCGGARSDFTGRVWRTQLEFIYNPKSWKFTHTVRVNGLVPENATLGNGIAEYKVHRLYDFQRLPFRI